MDYIFEYDALPLAPDRILSEIKSNKDCVHCEEDKATISRAVEQLVPIIAQSQMRLALLEREGTNLVSFITSDTTENYAQGFA